MYKYLDRYMQKCVSVWIRTYWHLWPDRDRTVYSMSRCQHIRLSSITLYNTYTHIRISDFGRYTVHIRPNIEECCALFMSLQHWNKYDLFNVTQNVHSWISNYPTGLFTLIFVTKDYTLMNIVPNFVVHSFCTQNEKSAAHDPVFY